MAGIFALLFAAVMFVISAVCFFIVFLCAQIWLIATVSLRFKEGAYVQAMLWGAFLMLMLKFDIALLTAIAQAV